MVIDFSSFYNFPYEFDKIFNDAFNPHHHNRRKASYPPLNISEDENNIYIRAEVPGVSINDMEITITAKNLVLKENANCPKADTSDRKDLQVHSKESSLSTLQLM